MESAVVTVSRRTFLAVSLVLLSSTANACSNLPPKSILQRIQDADLVVYGSIMPGHKTSLTVNDQNVQDGRISHVTFELYCVLKNELSSPSLQAELDKTQIKFDAIYNFDDHCMVQNEASTIVDAEDKKSVVTLNYVPSDDANAVKFQLDQQNEEPAIHIVEEGSELYESIKALKDSGFVDISTNMCEPKENDASTFRTNLLVLFWALASFYIFY